MISPRAAVLFLLGACASVLAQNESRLHRDFRVEAEALAACKRFSFGSLTDCGQTLATGQPLHFTFGSIAPQDGTSAGLAFVEHKDYLNETRLNLNIDAQASTNGSWQAGGYIKLYRLAGGTIHAVYPVAGPTPGTPAHKTGPFFNVAPLLTLYSETTSLTRVDFYGLGPNTTQATHTTFGMTENVTGASLALPLEGRVAPAKLALVLEANGRFPTLRAGTDGTIPSIQTAFTEATAPGGSHQSPFVQTSEGLRIDPALFKDSIRLNYLVQFQQYTAPGDSLYSFRRFNGDFTHTIPLYRLLGNKYASYRPSTLAYYGPDDCRGSSAAQNLSLAHPAHVTPGSPCPPISTTAKLEGSITLRAFLSESFAGAGSTVPFYFMPTIGGSDINGTTMLGSYPDYRFRGPDLLLFRGTLEHSLGKLPIGGIFSVDSGKIALRRGDLSLDHLRHTYSIGMTVHAGGLPVFDLLFSWGGKEGSHTSALISPTLLGGSTRPSLF